MPKKVSTENNGDAHPKIQTASLWFRGRGENKTVVKKFGISPNSDHEFLSTLLVPPQVIDLSQ